MPHVNALWVAVAALILLRGQQPIRHLTDAELGEPSVGEWVTHGRDYAETRYSPLTQINTGTVGRLGLAWSFNTESSYFVEATPLVHDGVMYGSLSDSVLFAIDARTGVSRWRWDPEIPTIAYQQDGEGRRVTGADGQPVRVGPSICCGRVNRGVAIYRDKVYAGLLDGRLVALDARTGQVAWQVETADFRKDYSITMAPRVVKGKVIVGNSGADFGVRGYVSAYDAETGNLAWRFYTVPGDPSQGFENAAMERAAATWTGEWWKLGGGGTVWDGISYDPTLDLLYVGTGNGGPWPRDIRSPGGGDNLFLASILALRPDTGEYVWHYQTTPGDTWDYGAQAGMTLADLQIGGRQRKVLMQANKNGFFYVLDRETGQFISAQPFTTVTWAASVDPQTGRPVEAPGARYGVGGAVIQPRSSGAHNWQAMSYSPDTGLAYIPARESSGFFQQVSDYSFEVGRRTNQGTSPNFDVPGAPNRSFLVAWDPVRQQERWRVADSRHGTLTTAGNLVFAATRSKFFAVDAETGTELWAAEGLRDGFSNPITYALDGRQYVTVASGSRNAVLLSFALDANAAPPR